MRLRSALLATAAVALAACQASDEIAAPSTDASFAATPAAASQRIPNRYIVVLRNDVRDVPGLARGLAAAHGGSVGFVYEAALKGFSITLGSDAAADAIARNPNVAYVEPDQVVTASATQNNATWGLDRIDQRALPLNGTFNYTATASNVWAYIVDTGIRTAHTQFGGRATLGFNAFTSPAKDGDCNGHGTHVAGTVGGSTFGVAKAVRLVAVRVLDCRGSGSSSGLLAGINYVVQQKTANPSRPMVANMSLGFGGVVSSIDNAVTNAIAAGISFVIAAGNSNIDACGVSPARTPNAITVGSTTSTDQRSSFSNFGSCVDIFAPGSNITSAWHTGNSVTNTISGTSMASPHVAGVVALYLAGNPNATPSQVTAALIGGATGTTTPGVVTNITGTNSPNRLLFTAY
jgi:subtilisin family serine protease